MNRAMNIAVVSPMMLPVPPVRYGGIELMVDELVRGLAMRGHQMTLFCAGGSTIEGKNIVRVETSPYPTNSCVSENRLYEKMQIKQVLEKQDSFDIIHFHYEPFVMSFEGEGNLLDRFRVPTLLTFHNSTHVLEHIEYYRNTPSLYRHTMTFVSQNQRLPLSFFPNTRVIYNAIPIHEFQFEEKKENFLLFLGRITPDKGILEAIKVAKITRSPLFIVARIDSSDQEFYENKVKPEIDGRMVRYIGEADFYGKIEYLKKARCLLMPIKWEEPFGLVMIEALACGTPVVAFQRGSVPEIIQDGVNGYVVRTVKEMAECVEKIDAIAPTACRKSVENRFDVSRMIDEYEAFFRDIILKKQS